MVRIGLVGVGFMGMIHYLASEKLREGKVTAICSRDPQKRAGDWTRIQGNFGPRGRQMDLTGVKAYAEFSELIADPDIDLVDLCVPNDEHAQLAVAALRAGKDVLVEKPIAVRMDDAELMVEAARESGRLLMVAHILPFFPAFAHAYRAAASGEFGRVRAAQFTRVISKPDWSAGIADVQRSGGPAVDLHIHDTHFVDLLCGTPDAVFSRGLLDQGVVTHLNTQYLYPSGGPVVSAVSGAIIPSGRPFAHGFEIALERATLLHGFGNYTDAPRVEPLTVLHEDGRIEYPTLPAGDEIDAFAEELATAVKAVQTREESPLLSAGRASAALRLCLSEIASVHNGEAVATR